MGTVVVSGAASGLGHVIVARLGADGHDLVLVDRDAAGVVRASREIAAAHGVTVETVIGDLSTNNGIDAIAAELQGREDLVALVNNAGGWAPGDQYPRAAEEVWMSAMTLNLLAPMVLTQRLWSALARRAGAVVNIGSSGGIGDEAYGSPEYGAAKAGLRRFTAALGDCGDVRVMAIVPGWIGLDRAHAELAQLSDSERQRQEPLVPPSEIADAVVRLVRHGAAGEVVEMLG